MSERSLADARSWVAEGTQLCAAGIDSLSDADFTAPSSLPGWSRAHLVAHVAANADALRNLAHWAATGEETPMYASSDQRNADIEAGSRRPPGELRQWFTRSAQQLDADFDALTTTAWAATVRTAQGRDVPASETLWMRAREVMVHAVDLGTGVRFDDLPQGFLRALAADITAKRGAEAIPAVQGDLAARTAWLAGRPEAVAEPVRATDGGPAPELPPWL